MKHQEAKISVRGLTEGALMAALTALLGIISIFIPVLWVPAKLLLAVPIILLIIRHNIKIGLMGLAVSSFLISIFIGVIQGSMILVSFGGMAIVYGYCFKRKLVPVKSIFFGFIANLFSLLLTLGISFFVSDLTFSKMTMELKQILGQMMGFYQKFEVFDKALEVKGMTYDQLKVMMFHWVDILVPGSIALSALAGAFLTYIVAQGILKKLHYDIVILPRFREWHFPWYSVWLVIIGLGLKASGNFLNYTVIENIGINLLYLLFPIFMVAGLSVIAYYWKNFPSTSMIRVGIIFLMFFAGVYLSYLLMIIGILDSLYDFRRFFSEKKRI